jgi:hypothetical protein
MAAASGALRALLQEIYLQDLVLALYRVYARRVRDEEGRRLIETYLRSEEDRGRRMEGHLARRGAAPSRPVRALFDAIGDLYGRATSRLGTRVMLRITLSASRRAARRACAALVGAPGPELLYFATLRARHEGDLADALRQHLIDTRRR